jgi:acetyl esterase/lipase
MSEFVLPDASIFEPFELFEETYKTVSSHHVKATFIIPKNLKPGTHPVIVNAHGGFLTTGHASFAGFMPGYVLKLALQGSAIIISMDYRLLPTANGVADILEDLEDFWQWFKKDASAVLQKRHPEQSLDFSKVLLTGGSAGGYAATQIALSHPDEVAAVAMTYPMVDIQDRQFTEGPSHDEPTVSRIPLEHMMSKEDTLATIESLREQVHTVAELERFFWTVSSVQHGLFVSALFDNKGLGRAEFFPIRMLQSGANLPKTMQVIIYSRYLPC